MAAGAGWGRGTEDGRAVEAGDTGGGGPRKGSWGARGGHAMQDVGEGGNGGGNGRTGFTAAEKSPGEGQEGRWAGDPPGEGPGESVAALAAARYAAHV